MAKTYAQYPRFTRRGPFLFIRQPDLLTVNLSTHDHRAHKLLAWVHTRGTIPESYRVGCLDFLPPSPHTLDAVRHFVRRRMRQHRVESHPNTSREADAADRGPEPGSAAG